MTRAPHDDAGSLLDRNRSALAVVDAELELDWGNEEFLRLFPGARLGGSLAEVAGPWLRPRVRHLLARVAADGVDFGRVDAVWPTEGRTRMLTAHRLPGTAASRSVLLCVAEEESAATDTPPPRRSGETSAEALAAEIALHFSNLMVGVLGYAALAEQQLEVDSSAAGSLRRVQGAARSAVEFTEGLLMFAARTAGPLEHVELQPILEDARERLHRGRSGERIALKLRIEPGIRTVPGEGRQWSKVIASVVDNAAAAISGPGTILIEAGAVHSGFGVPSDGSQEGSVFEHGHVRIRIVDSGTGMDSATLRRACEPFFSAGSAGCGLGLAASRGYLRGLGGTLAISSEPGKGTTVDILVPQIPSP